MSSKETAIKLFEQRQIRTHWDDGEEKWYFSIVDVIGVLTDSPNPRKYWSVLKTRLKREGSELTTSCSQLKMRAADGKFYNTDVADTEQLFRLIQSVPSKKAEPFKLWLAKVGRERIDEIEDPELGIERLMETYLRKGYSKEWINQRLKSIEVRKELTDEWDERGVQKGQEYAILTDEITRAWSGFSVREYKRFKDLKKENLRDNMTISNSCSICSPRLRPPRSAEKRSHGRLSIIRRSPAKAEPLPGTRDRGKNRETSGLKIIREKTVEEVGLAN